MKPDFLGLLRALVDSDVEFVVVGGVAAILEGAPITTLDLDIVYRPDAANRERLQGLLDRLHGRYRDPSGRDIRPTVERLGAHQTNLLETDLGLLDAMQTIGPGWSYQDLVERSRRRHLDDFEVSVLDLATNIEAKQALARDKDKAMLPLLIRTLEARKDDPA